MSDDYCRYFFEKMMQGILDFFFGFQIKVRRCFIKKQKIGLLVDGTRYAEALLFAPRKLNALFAHERIHSLRQFMEKIRNMGYLNAFLEGFFVDGIIRPRECDIVFQGKIKYFRILQNNSDALEKGFSRE